MENVTPSQFLRDLHKRIKGLFIQLEATELRTPSLKKGIIRELLMELEIENILTKELFYPAIKEIEDSQTGASLTELTALRETEGHLFEAVRSSGSAESLSDLKQLVLVNFDTEESSLFPSVEFQSSENMPALTQQMENRRRELLRSPQYVDSLPEKVQDPRGGEQMRRKSSGEAS